MRGTARNFGVLGLALMVQFAGLPCLAQPAGYESDTRAYNLAHGRVVFAQQCTQCHEQGQHDAPILGDTADWIERINRPLDELIEHAIKGHGDMPARGDREITDQDIAAAVAFVVNRSRVIAAEELNALPPTAAGVSVKKIGDPTDEAVVQMFLMLFGKDRWR